MPEIEYELVVVHNIIICPFFHNAWTERFCDFKMYFVVLLLICYYIRTAAHHGYTVINLSYPVYCCCYRLLGNSIQQNTSRVEAFNFVIYWIRGKPEQFVKSKHCCATDQSTLETKQRRRSGRSFHPVVVRYLLRSQHFSLASLTV